MTAERPLQALQAALASHLVTAGKATGASLERAERVSAAGGQSLVTVLPQLGLIGERELAEILAGLCGVALIDATAFPAVPLCGDVLNRTFLKAARLLPVREDSAGVTIAMADPLDEQAIAAVRFAIGKPVRRCVATPGDLDAAHERLYGAAETVTDAAKTAAERDEAASDDLDRLQDMASQAPVVRLVNQLIARAVEAGASDIHLEAQDAALRVRLRIDGVLREAEPPPPRLRAAVISRIKIMAKLNIAERRLPQDGRIGLAVRGQEVDIRVATMPTLHGESVVLRLLDQGRLALDLASLGFDEALIERFRTVLARPHGIVLVTGPTGSGKTTTLYAGLLELNTADKKILTVEDPIEYQLSGINQVQVKPQIGLTFAGALRAFLRHNPNIMMVGEIRDLETTQVAIQAALTGHLILSTLHTNDAASAVTRLLDMGAEPYLLTATLTGIAAQRLIRVLCPACRQPYTASPEMLARLGADGFGSGGQVTFYRAAGCGACGGTGYRGRTAICEILIASDVIRGLILRQAEAAAIRRAARAEGMLGMAQHGMAKALAGITSVEEVARATREM